MPSPELVRFFEAVPVGLASGILSGLFGVGGGIISVPLARHVLGVVPHVAIGSTLAVILPTSCVGIYNYMKQGRLAVPLALYSGIPAAIGSIAGSNVSKHVEGQILMLGLTALMLLIGVDFLSGYSSRIRKKANESDNNEFRSTPRNIAVAIVSGLLIGLMAGMVGIGGGFILVPLYCYAFGLPVKTAFGSSLIVVALVALPGTIVHTVHEHVDLTLVGSLLVGSLPGAWLGSRLALKTKDEVLKHAFGIILIALSLVFAWREYVILSHHPLV
ncbi:MAG: sulfite exporter TauE/SafE family protein [Candidatus Obscuribacterales bacterium]|nr:sulfite exporter TauE/SafE family protein [Candidatus Obscuribacterales bacterium]